MRNAFLAGTPVAAGCALAGFFLTLRTQVFTADALGHVAFVGAVAAAAVGVGSQAGLLVATLAAAAVLGVAGGRGRDDDVATGTAFAAILGAGVLLLSLSRSGNGVVGARALFGSIFGLDAGEAWLTAAIAVSVAGALAVVARPLLFATLDPLVAVARGVPVRALGVGFLLGVALLVAQATQAVGALLALGLMAAPAGAALRLTSRPFLGIMLACALGVGSMWVGLSLSYAVGTLPPSSGVIGVATAVYVCSAVVARARRRPIIA